MARETFQIGDLTAVIGDNEGYDGHRAGYNGVTTRASLRLCPPRISTTMPPPTRTIHSAASSILSGLTTLLLIPWWNTPMRSPCPPGPTAW